METNVQANPVSTRSVGVKFGLISALVSIVLFLVLMISGANAFDNSWSWLGIGISIVLLVFAHKDFKNSGTGYMKYGQGVAIGFWMALISIIIGGLITFVYVSFIDTGAMEAVWDAQAEEMARKGVPEEQIEMGLSIGQKMFWPMYFIGGLIGGVVVALLVSIFTQKKDPRPAF